MELINGFPKICYSATTFVRGSIRGWLTALNHVQLPSLLSRAYPAAYGEPWEIQS
jgi:hypothetical protein